MFLIFLKERNHLRRTKVKLFIIPYFEYCSFLIICSNSISFYSQNPNIDKLIKCYNKNVKLFDININLLGLENNLEHQIRLLIPFKVVPLPLRLFRKIYSYTLKILVKNRCTQLLTKIKFSKITSNDKIITRQSFKISELKNKWGLNSFRHLAMKLANKFNFKDVDDMNISLHLNNMNRNIFQHFESSNSIFL